MISDRTAPITRKVDAAAEQGSGQVRGLPERTCIGCRGRASKPELLRLVVEDGRLIIDESGRAPGRGAYVHPACVELAIRRKAVGRALRNTELDGAHIAATLRRESTWEIAVRDVTIKNARSCAARTQPESGFTLMTTDE